MVTNGGIVTNAMVTGQGDGHAIDSFAVAISVDL